jgi:RNA polymerase sigma-B factor
VRELLEELPERERTIVYMRFFENMTQPEIAERVGVSQSYLSRILRKTLLDLRARIAD